MEDHFAAPPNPAPETVLVTGANGFVGINLVNQLASRGVQVLATSRRPPDVKVQSEHAGSVEWLLCDVTQREALIELVKSRAVTRIVHAAAVTPTPDIEKGAPARVVDVNLVGTLNALEAARLAKVKRLVFVSSSVVYRGFPLTQGLAREEDALPPTNLYGICKDACERMCRHYRMHCGLSTVSVRLGTAYGPLERNSFSRTRLSAIAQLVAWCMECPTQPLQVQGPDIVRDYIFVEDACAALAELALHPNLGWDIYNLSSEIVYPLEEALRALQTHFPLFQWLPASSPETADFGFQPSDTRAPLDMSRMSSDLPQVQFRDLNSGIADYVAWVQKERKLVAENAQDS